MHGVGTLSGRAVAEVPGDGVDLTVGIGGVRVSATSNGAVPEGWSAAGASSGSWFSNGTLLEPKTTGSPPGVDLGAV